MQFNLIKEILTGSITGYITNAIAIKMIFREYGIGKLKLGGIVIKTKDEFIDNVSSLVERDIINPNTLKPHLEKESFRYSIEKFIEDLLNVHIYINTSKLHIGDIEGFNSTINRTENYIGNFAEENFAMVFDSFCRNIYLKDLLSENQIKYISKELFNSISDSLDSKDFIEKTIEDFYNENRNLSFGEFFGNKLITVVSKNFENNLKDLPELLKKDFDNSIDDVIENTIRNLGIYSILQGLEERFKEKRIIDFIKVEEGTNLSLSLINKIKTFLESEDGKELMISFSRELITLLKSIDKPILDMFSTDLKENIEGFLKDKLQYIVKEIILWIENNRGDIENLIERAIDDTIESLDGGMKQGIMNIVRDKFLNNVANKFDIVSKITEYLDRNVSIDAISKDVTASIIKYLKEENISDIIYILERNNVVTEESITSFINYNFINYIDYIPESYFSQLLNKKIKDIFNISLQKLFDDNFKSPLIKTIKNSYLYKEEVTKTWTKELIEGITYINNLNFQDLIPEAFVSLNAISIKKVVIEELNYNRDKITDLFYKELNKFINPLTLDNFLNEKIKKDLLIELKGSILYKSDDILNRFKDIEIKDIYDSINNIKNIKSMLANSTELILKENLKDILDGNIKLSVSNNLYKLKDEDLQVIVEEFMGKEMKPITIIGAILGAVVGIAMYFFNGVIPNYNYISGVIISIAAYALVGWLTNVQALAMLFKPYKEKRVLGFKVPFTPGVIVSRKPKFAKAMSEFVDEELLNRESMEDLFRKNKDNICNKLKEMVSKDNYKLLVDLLDKHKDKIGRISFDYSKKAAYNSKNKLRDLLVEQVVNFTFHNVDLSKAEVKAEELIGKVKISSETISYKLYKFLISEKPVEALIPNNIQVFIKKALENRVKEKIDNKFLYITKEDKRKELILLFSEEYNKILKRPVEKVVGSEQINLWKKNFNKFIENKIASQKSRDEIFSWLENLLSKELNPNKKVGQLFSGIFVKVVEDNFNYIMDNVVKTIVKGLSKNQGNIEEVAITTTKENLNFFEIMGYNMLGGDQIIAAIVDNLINDKLPSFIEVKREELKIILEDFIDNKICNSTIGDFDIKLDRSGVLNIISKFINDEENISILNNNIGKIIDSMFNWMTEVNIEEYLNQLSINRVEDLRDLFNEELKFIQEELVKNFDRNKKTIVDEYSKVVYEVFEKFILSKEMKVFTTGLDEDYIKNISKKISAILNNSDSIRENSKEFVKNLADLELQFKTAGEFLNLEELNTSILSLIEKLMENKEINSMAESLINNMVKGVIGDNLSIIDYGTKEALRDMLVRSIVDSAEDNFELIIKNIDFKDITEKEINNMKPEEIEDLFNSFAKKYFNRLKLYGLGGGVFGIHWMLGVIFTILYAGSSLKEGILEKNNRKV